jgi:hypothetical protein
MAIYLYIGIEVGRGCGVIGLDVYYVRSIGWMGEHGTHTVRRGRGTRHSSTTRCGVRAALTTTTREVRQWVLSIVYTSHIRRSASVACE